jgi:hypothetical protein
MSKKLFLEHEITAVEEQFLAFCKELHVLDPLPPKVSGALQSLGQNIKKLKPARDNAAPLGIHVG